MKLELVAPSLALALLAGLPPEGPAFRPAEGDEVTKTFTETTSWRLEDMEQIVAGRESREELPDMESRASRVLVLEDRFGPLSGDRPARIERTVEELSGAVEIDFAVDGMEERYDIELESELADAELVFRWSEDDGEYAVGAPDESLEAELLEGLDADADFTALLPAEEVAEGDGWDLEAEDLAAVFAPGGNWCLEPVEMSGSFQVLQLDDVLAATLVPLYELTGSIEGEARAVWSGTDDSEGRSLAVIDLEIDLTLTGDLDERLNEIMERKGIESSRNDFSLLIEWKVKGEGQLLWDMEHQRFHAYDLSAELAGAVEMLWTIQAGDQDVPIEANFDIAGSTELSARRDG